ncbi:haloacid dehalogenase type II [Arenibaculum pallidiluteum]|uniref:haloacid dehalogenase type II n=1 Tax=Arenibaculum pallidiluteum TaxID=2812559 RepID=UPI001A95EDB4|nr:haloacid dehalogenase type II [Arenibaculum pallidiluteum]
MAGLAVFDAYGTLFDVHSAVRRHAAALGDGADGVSQLWRARQLEYAWIASLSGRYRDFWTLTGEALDFALAAHGIDDPALRASLMDAYLQLDPYPEVPGVLARLREAGVRTAILSNGSPMMLERAVKSAALGDLLDAVLSVDEVGAYKPDPRVYALACERLGVAPEAVAFQSSNAWDAAGAAAYGFRVHWINRSGQPREYAAMGPVLPLTDLSTLPALLG